MRQPSVPSVVCALVAAIGLVSVSMAVEAPKPSTCANPVYLIVDPASMDFAPRIADVLQREQVKVSFLVSNHRTTNGEGSLGNQWGGWWKLVADQGHEFISHTYDHVAWRGDLPGYRPAFRMKPAAGALEGREFTFDPPKLCEQIEHAAHRVEDFTHKKTLPLFSLPGSQTSPKLLASASACGYAHIGVARGRTLANGLQLKTTLQDIRSGDVLLADLHTSNATEPWALHNLEPLIDGLKERGLCFESLRKHPGLKEWIETHGG
jgi:peptidoglycan/xylan/chitin deacetylase (PgdA/CDA1 family)